MFQAYGKHIWRLSGFALFAGLLGVFSVAAYALLQPALNQTIVSSSGNPASKQSGALETFPQIKNDTKSPLWHSNSDGSYRIQTLGKNRPNAQASDQIKPVLMGIERESLAHSSTEGHYITLNTPGDFFVLPAAIHRIIPANKPGESIIEIGQIGQKHVLEALSPGYYRIETDDIQSNNRWYSLFVSPVPSRHLDRTDRDWYLTQFNTETTSNCGPSVAAMAVRWAAEALPGVLDIRQYLGWNGDGAVSMWNSRKF